MNRERLVERIPVNELLALYASGRFPMAHEDGQIHAHEPDPRAVFPLDRLVPDARLRRLVRSGRFSMTMDKAFPAVINACADRPDTWIDPCIMTSYVDLHHAGHAHSVETWECGRLVGGIYGVALGGAFFGESMFSRVSNAGKVAFHTLVEHLQERGFQLFDTQYINPFTRQLGAVEIPKARFLLALRHALASPVRF